MCQRPLPSRTRQTLAARDPAHARDPVRDLVHARDHGLARDLVRGPGVAQA